MSKWMSIFALGAALAVCGCKNNEKDMSNDSSMSSEPKKMSVDSGKTMKADGSKCTSCEKAAK